jgi:hypothetical protein
MPVICRNLLVVALVVIACRAQGSEPSGSVANISTPTTAPGPQVNPFAANNNGAAKSNERLREGTKLVDVTGTFQSAGGDSISFSRDGGRESFRVLENQALQRVGQTIETNPNAKRWVISGVITEYRSTNYLLLTKVVVQLTEGDNAAGQ